ncbi:cytochrome P450 [Pontivivens insulae]|uniref:Biotin biosynthesis cytochrome P450 n=1 Tax=Pontivivens insulae TaxID=1639689 RepID=A0A2R8AA98_9RHOB|nr:cytochrome P450 [Pontivivens insulae]RED13051.1 unspecific monooxygenase [Pontivivens insulae]SPF29143.1 Biotin biosynthesis cytochrome P450 [Pontivivens insulae]
MSLPRLSQSPLEHPFVQDPYPFYEIARAAGPLFHWEEYGHACAAGHAEVNAILRDRRFGRENPFPKPTPPHLEPFYAVDRLSMLEREPPEHTRLRRLVMRDFTSRRVSAMTPEIEALAHRLIDEMPPEGDLLSSFCETLPVIVICRLLGVPEDMAPQLLRWSHAMVAMYQVRRDRVVEDAAVAATLDFTAYLQSYIAERRADPREDLISALIAADEDRLNEDELIATCILLLNAGHEATVHALGNGVKTLISNDMWHPHDPDLLTEEILRFDPPLHMFTRFAMEDVEVGGHHFAKGEVVGLMLASANRDEAVFADAARFDPTRTPGPQLSLGAGLHFCVGAPLAKLEVATALPILIARCPDLRIIEPPVYADRYHFHGLEKLICAT